MFGVRVHEKVVETRFRAPLFEKAHRVGNQGEEEAILADQWLGALINQAIG